MIKYLCIAVLALPLMACDKKADDKADKVSETSNSSEVQKQEIIVGDKILITNELLNKNLKLTAHDTNLSKANEYYYQVTIQNLSDQPINITADQITLVDSKGGEHKVDMIDRELTIPIAANTEVVGIIGFDDVQSGNPQLIKFKEI